jgi:chromosome segregation protein
MLDINQSELKRELVTLRERRSNLRTDISVETNLIENYLALKLNESEGQLIGFREEIESLEYEHAKTIEEIQKLSSEIEELNKALDKMTSEVESSNDIIQLHQKTLSKINQQIEHLDGRNNTLGIKKMELNVELEKLRIRCEQKLDELKELGFNDKLKTDGINIEDLERILSSIRADRSSLGAINQLAVEQYAQVVGNYKQLSVRINELEEEKSSILQFIDEVEQEKQAHFMKAFNEVCENFSNIFARLTGGGDGRLELQKPEKPFSGGVDLYIQFPGKPMRLASGASGGERSVAATAYLLAIQRFLKAPFYLLDEVDAHLDDLNVSRLAGVLRDNALESQFIVVTLKDVMVHNADRIYGVFNQSGKSRVLSLPVKMEVPL